MNQKTAEKRQIPVREGNRQAAVKAISMLGGFIQTAKLFEISREAVHQWALRGVPASRVRSLSRLVDHEMTPEEIRPDIFSDV